MPACFAAINQVRHQLGGTGNERGTVTGKVRLLRQRVHGKQAGEVTITHSMIQDGRHRLTAARLIPGAPTELRVAPYRTPPRHRFYAPAPQSSRSCSTVAPHRSFAGEFTQISFTRLWVSASSSSRLSAVRTRRGKAGTHIVGGVRNARVHDHRPAQTQQERQPCHEFLRTDRGHNRLRAQTGHTAAASKPFGNSLTQGGGAVGGRVAGGVGGLASASRMFCGSGRRGCR